MLKRLIWCVAPAFLLIATPTPDAPYISYNSCEASTTCGGCPPLYCVDKAAAKRSKDAKARKAEAQGLPKRLSKLFYQLPDCVGCVQLAPDWVTIAWEVDQEAMQKLHGTRVQYDKHWEPWSAELEWKLREQMQQGLVKEVHFMVQGGARCRCCTPGKYKEFRYRINQDAKDEKRMDNGENVGGYDSDFEYYKPYGEQLKNPSDIPKDLNEVPDSLRYPDSITMPPLRMEPAERPVTQPCLACKNEADAYNKTVEAFNALRRPLAKAKQNVGFYAKVNAYAWRAYSATRMIADPAAREKAETEALDLYRTRMRQWDDAKAELTELIEKRAALKTKLKEQFQRLLECEERCREKPSIHEENDDDIEIELEDARSIGGDNAFNAGGIEELGNTDTPTPVQPNKPMVTTAPPVAVAPPTTTSGGGNDTSPTSPPSSPPPTAPVAFDVTFHGKLSFHHVVGRSPCPQNAGQVSFQGSKGPVQIVSATASAGIQAKLILSPQGDRLKAQFNCSSPDNGTFTGTITAQVRDVGTGELKTIAINASGTVSSP